MRCPNCGIEVVQEADFCHKCGGRLDWADRPLPATDPAAAEPGSGQMPSPAGPEAADTEPEPSPNERFQESVEARRGADQGPEQDLWRGGYSSKAMIGWWVLGGLVTIALVVLAFWVWRSWVTWLVVVLVVLLWLYQLFVMKYRQWNVRYRLTDQRFIHETGILRRVTDRIETIDMDDITFEKKLLERLVGVGTIRITSSDKTHPELLLQGIDNVKEVSEKIDDIRRSERRRRGLHIESI